MTLRPYERSAAESILDRPGDPDSDAAIVARAALRLAARPSGEVHRHPCDECDTTLDYWTQRALAVEAWTERVIEAARVLATMPAGNISGSKDRERIAERYEAFAALRAALLLRRAARPSGEVRERVAALRSSSASDDWNAGIHAALHVIDGTPWEVALEHAPALEAAARPSGDALAILDVIDGIVDDTHPEGDGCPLCTALDDLRDALDGRREEP